MDEYFIGIIKDYQNGTIIFECNSKGFIMQGVNLHLLPLNQELKLYVYFYQRLPVSEYFAFLNQKTKQYFLKLININYIGPKIALNILNFFSIEEFIYTIKNNNIKNLQEINGVTNKLASTILEHFKFFKF